MRRLFRESARWLPAWLALGGCGGPSTSGAASAAGIPGYVHTLAKSRFQLGTVVSTEVEGGVRRVVGTDGVFATQLVSQAATAIPSDTVQMSPDFGFPGGADAQNAAVVAYFTGAGLPADQVSGVSADETGYSTMTGGISDPLALGWFSTLQRTYEGTPIEDSTACATLGSDGASLEEQVFWPAIGADVVEQVQAFEAILNDPDRQAAFLATLPGGLQGGSLVIHHTGWMWQGTFVAVACYRATLGGTTVYFDATGHAVELPDEVSEDGAETLVECPSGSPTVPPSGACVGAGTCTFELTASCGPGIAYRPVTPPVYDCSCSSGTWSCQVVGGGLGLIACDGGS